jgi:type IV pilus assembly protein PilQ
MKKNNRRLITILGGILLFIFGLGENSSFLWAKTVKTSPQARLIQMENQVLQDRIRVILKTNRTVEYRSIVMTDPPRLVLDLKPCVLGLQESFAMKDSSIAGIRFSQFNPKTVRIVFDLYQAAPYHISYKKGAPFQIFVDFPLVKPQMPEPVSKQPEEKNLPQTTLEDFKKEKAFQDIQLKEEQTHLKKPPVTFDFYMANLHNVLRVIGSFGEKNIVIGEEVKDKKVTLSLKEVNWEEAFDSILEGNYLEKVIHGENTYLVTTKENFKKIMDDKNKSKLDEIKIVQEELKAEEQRQKVGKITWEKRQFQIKNVDVKLVEDIIQGSIEKEKKIASEKGQGGQQTTTTTETFRVSGANVHILSVSHTNTLIARGTERELDYIEELIKIIDQPVSQVMIEARIVEANANFTRDLGIRWGGANSFADTNSPFAGMIRGGDAGTGSTASNYAVNLPLQATSAAFGGLGFSFASSNLNIDVRIQAMEQQGRGKIISSPKVLTLDNQEATIKQGQSVPVTTRTENNTFSTTYRDAALVLKVTPHISSSKKIRIKVEITKDELDDTRRDQLGNFTINTKEAKTEMMVNDGDTVVIGGIIFKKETNNENKIPLLGDIPFLGWLFKTRYRHTEDTEMLIFLTPKMQKSSLPDRFRNDS